MVEDKLVCLMAGVIVAFVVSAAVVGLVWLRRQVRRRRTSHKVCCPACFGLLLNLANYTTTMYSNGCSVIH